MSRKPISDLDLFSNLKRRTADARSELSRDSFVASVRSKIEAGPTTVRMSRAPALVGLASVVAVLLVLVVALPGLRPGPSGAPTASPSPGTAMSAAEFESRFRSGQLDGQSVLLNGRIEESDTSGYGYGLDCNGLEGEARGVRPAFTCTMGRIVGTEPSLWAEAPYLAEAPERWRAASSPAQGTLLLHVTPVGFIEYIGTVAVTAGEPSSVRAASALHIDSLGLNDVVLVDASLTGVPARECPANPSAMADLPGRGCEPSTLNDASGTMAVQDNAYFEFAPEAGQQPPTGAVAPRRALYAIAKRLEGCGETPCWQWSVVARLTGSTGPVATPLAESTPTTTPTALTDARFECTGPPPPPGIDVLSGPVPVVIDTTGLVESCLMPDVIYERQGAISVTNVDERILHVEWQTDACDNEMVFTFTELQDDASYGLTGERPNNCVVRVGSGGSERIQIRFNQPMPAEQVRPAIDSVRPIPSPTRPAADQIDCADLVPQPRYPINTVAYDSTGLIETCKAVEPTRQLMFDPDGLYVDHPDGDQGILRISWLGGACDGDMALRFDQQGGGYVLSRETHADSDVCIMVGVLRAVQFDLGQPVEIDQIMVR